MTTRAITSRPLVDRVTLSRTLPPMSPTDFLSRESLFDRFGAIESGVALLVAPAGYGKTSLVVEWASKSNATVIWFTANQNDSVRDIANHMVQAVRNVIPGYAPWYEESPDLSLEEVVRRGSNELLSLKTKLICVVDDAHLLVGDVQTIGQLFIDSMPPSCKVVIVRRTAPMTSFSQHSNANQLSLITGQDLVFSNVEVSSLLSFNGVSKEEDYVQAIMATTHGWPAAASLLVRNLSRGAQISELTENFTNRSDPLRYLANESLISLELEDRVKLTKLSIFEEIDPEIADLVLETNDSFQFLLRLTKGGLFLTRTSNPARSYRINPLIREILLVDLSTRIEEKSQLHRKAAYILVKFGKTSQAMGQAHQSGDRGLIVSIFTENARKMAATGLGDQLLKWSHYLGGPTLEAQIFQSSAELSGHLANTEFDQVDTLISEMIRAADSTHMREFVLQVTSMSRAYKNFSLGRFAELENDVKVTLEVTPTPIALIVEDKLPLLRLLAGKAFIVNDCESLIEANSAANLLAVSVGNIESTYHLACMQSLVLFEQGRYFEAHDLALKAIAIAREQGFVGVVGPFDALYVVAHCEGEFLNRESSLAKLIELSELAKKWKQWSWYFFVQGKISDLELAFGRVKDAFEILKTSRTIAERLILCPDIDAILDKDELLLRYRVGDKARCQILLGRIPKTRFSEQIRVSLEFQNESLKSRPQDSGFASGTPRQDLYLALYDTFINLDSESVALKHLRRAIDIAAEHGARRTLLVQGPRVLNLIIKLATINSTVFMESLARMATGELQTSKDFKAGLVEALTSRELEVLRNLATGLSIGAIGASLHISGNTMKTHLRHIYRKLEVDGRDSAVDKAKSLFII